MQKGEYVYRRAGFLLALTWADMPEKMKISAKAALLREQAFADLVS